MEQKALDAWDSQSPAIRLCQPGSHPLSHAQLLAPQQVQTDGRADVANEQASQEDGERARETERERASERAMKKERERERERQREREKKREDCADHLSDRSDIEPFEREMRSIIYKGFLLRGLGV